MAPNSETRSDELTLALEAAAVAGDLIRERYCGDFDVRDKTDGSPVTDVDEACEDAIRQILSARFPGDAIHGEERGVSGGEAGGGGPSGSAPRTWLIDPIDGTKSFVRGYPMLSVQIALLEGDQLALGVSHAPVYGDGGETAWAELGKGAWLDGIAMKVSSVRSLADATLSTGNLRSLAAADGWAALGSLVTEVDRIRGYGDFLHYHLLASGRIDVVVESDLNILDIAALTVIVREAGGVVTDLAGEPVGLDTTSIIASNGFLHDIVLGRLGGGVT